MQLARPRSKISGDPHEYVADSQKKQEQLSTQECQRQHCVSFTGGART